MIYLDNAATTPLDDEVLEAMLPYMRENFGNPQSQHAAGRAAANALTSARDRIAEIFGCGADEVYFVSGGTEAGNTALKGVCLSRGRGHLVLSAIEHPALLESAKDLKGEFEITYVKPDKNGIINPSDVANALREDTVFCAVMTANNEVGTIQPYEEIGEICKKRGVFYYTDCVQSAGVLPFNANCCSSLGVSAHKFYGPRGVGAIYIKKGSKISRLISGGRQERGFRGGTVNVAGAVGCAVALERAVNNSDENNKKMAALRDSFIKKVLSEIEGTHLNGDIQRRVPSNANISFEGCDGENLLFLLDMKGICVSTGSACSAGAVSPSHVLTAMGLSESRVKSAVRFSFGKYNTIDEVDFTVNALKEAVNKIRKV
ncbi:MAG: cysteine desulfurase [Clostridiales bacterium]|nr:cysteine desulfurase [Clostridiales bacterium]